MKIVGNKICFICTELNEKTKERCKECNFLLSEVKVISGMKASKNSYEIELKKESPSNTQATTKKKRKSIFDW